MGRASTNILMSVLGKYRTLSVKKVAQNASIGKVGDSAIVIRDVVYLIKSNLWPRLKVLWDKLAILSSIVQWFAQSYLVIMSILS